MYARSRSASNVGLGAGEGALGRGEGALERGVGGERRPDAIAVAIYDSLQLSSSLVCCSREVLPLMPTIGFSVVTCIDVAVFS